MAKTELTTWELRTYDVWGNKEDGYDVNDSFRAGTIDLRLKIQTYNAGLPGEFQGAYPSDYQILKHVFSCDGAIETDGDDLTIYVSRARVWYV